MENLVEKIIGSAEKIGSVGKQNHRYFFRPDAMVWCMRIVVVLVLTVAQ